MDTAKTNPLNALTIKQLEQLKEKGIDQESIIYQVHVTGLTWQQQLMQDIPYTYIVVKNEDANGGCVVYGWSDSGWYANPTLRWLVMHFIEKENAAKQKLQSSYSDIPDKPGFNKVAIFADGGVGLCYEDPEMEKDSEEMPWPSDWPERITREFLEAKGFRVEVG